MCCLMNTIVKKELLDINLMWKTNQKGFHCKESKKSADARSQQIIVYYPRTSKLKDGTMNFIKLTKKTHS